MNLWKFKHKKYTPQESEYISEGYWGLNLFWFGIELVWTSKSREFNEWRESHTNNYYIWWNWKHFSFGSMHNYYDGPHCAFSLGWLKFGYVPKDGWCDRCYEGK